MREWNGSRRCFSAISLAILALGWAALSQAQYMHIVTDNSIDNTRLNATGTTLLTLILDTNHDKDGSLQTCNSHTAACGAPTTTQPLNLFGYAIIMTASGGTVSWGTFTPADAAYTILQPQVSDGHDVEFVFQRPAGTFSPEGVNTIGTIPVTVVDGNPRIDFVRSIALDVFAPPTNFNTACDGFNFPNSYALGNPLDPCFDPIGPGDWFDADGALAPVAGSNTNPVIVAPATAAGTEGSPLATITATATDVDLKQTLTITQAGMPADLTFSTTPGTTRVTATISGTPGLSDAGTYNIVWTVNDGNGGTASTTTVLTIANLNQTPTLAVQVSGLSPFDGCTADQVFGNIGWAVPNCEVEPWLAVNPTNPSNLVALWSQDWTHDRQGARGLVAGVSFDGGKSWRIVPIPGLTLCTGGSAVRTGDPWLAFASNGDLFLSALGVGVNSNGGIAPPSSVLVTKSTDGGLTWGPVVTLIEDAATLQDKESVTADPTNPNFAYVVWDAPGAQNAVMFSRTIDGGQSWEPARPIYNPLSFNLPIGNQIVVLPDGTLLDFFAEGRWSGTRFDSFTLSLIRSRDKGVTWEPDELIEPTRIAELKTPCPISQACGRDPETGQLIRDAIFIFDVAVDPNNGNLYLQWTDGRFSNFQFTSVAFSMSTDGGLTWSEPIQINKTPTGIPPGNQQAFGHSVHVAPDGTIGVAYYDFRFNDANPGLLTDYWLVHCHSATDCSDPANWRDENRLTGTSFDIEKAVFSFGLFVGDYQGMASDDGDLLTVWGQPHDADPGSIFFERVKLLAVDLDPDVINLHAGAPWVTAYIEPAGFDPASIDISTLRLAGSVPAASKFAVIGDHDTNGTPDLMVKFGREALDPLLTPGVIELEVTGSLVTGEDFKGSDEVRVIDPPTAPLSASVAPNPLNPAGVLTFRTPKPGPVIVKMFDFQGRLVRALMEAPLLPAGVHELRIDGRGLRGEVLPSGVYFYRIDSADETITGRFAILK